MNKVKTGARSATVLLLSFALMVSAPLAAYAEAASPLRAVAQKVGCSYEDILSSDLLVPGESVSDWVAIATGCSGDPVKRTAYLQGLEEYVSQAYQEDGYLHSVKATEWHRISLAVLALGGDPTNFGTDASGRPINLIADGTYNWTVSDSLGMQGLNGLIFALITLDAMYYPVPSNAVYSREAIIAEILAGQSDEGGFGLSGDGADVDITAMALQALAPYYNLDPLVKGSVDRALGWLSAQQNADGGFTSWGTGSAEGSAQVIIALCSLGIDCRTDERFVKDGVSAFDGLLQYQAKSGMFLHELGGEEDVMATEQAALALIAVGRFDQDGNRLYDFTEIAVYQGEDDVVTGKASVGSFPWAAVGAVVVLAGCGVGFMVIRRGRR